MKRFVTLLLVVLLLVPTVAVHAEEGKVLNIYCWNTEFQDRFNAYFRDKGLVPEGITVNFVITPNEGNAYQTALNNALLTLDEMAVDDRPDMFLVEADSALVYVDSDYAMPVADLGITEEDTAKMYQYTKDIMTDSNGVLKGLSWQACPGGYIYRRAHAKDVLGTDDPVAVQEALSDWAKFDAVAAQAKEKGYFMLSGFDDAFRVFSDNMTSPWVDADGLIHIDESIMQWIEQTKLYTDMGYNNKANLWSAESGAGAGKDGKVFGYFGPGWFIDFSLAGWTLDDTTAPSEVGNGSWGDWAVVKGPQGFSWGGTWLCAVNGTDNPELVKQLMLTLTCDEETLVAIAKDMGDFTNNVPAMEVIAKSDYAHPFLGGQNHISAFLDSATSIDRSNMSAYDQACSERIQASMADYFNGIVDLDTAFENFYIAVEEIHPELSH